MSKGAVPGRRKYKIEAEQKTRVPMGVTLLWETQVDFEGSTLFRGGGVPVAKVAQPRPPACALCCDVTANQLCLMMSSSSRPSRSMTEDRVGLVLEGCFCSQVPPGN